MQLGIGKGKIEQDVRVLIFISGDINLYIVKAVSLNDTSYNYKRLFACASINDRITYN